jgi:hypothetical protein
MEAIPDQEDLMPHEVATVEVESETPQHHLYHALMRDYEEDPLRLEDDFDDLDDYPDMTAPMWMSTFLRMVVMVGIESLVLSLMVRNKITLA